MTELQKLQEKASKPPFGVTHGLCVVTKTGRDVCCTQHDENTSKRNQANAELICYALNNIGKHEERIQELEGALNLSIATTEKLRKEKAIGSLWTPFVIERENKVKQALKGKERG